MKMKATFFAADTHFGHEKILWNTPRDFDSIERMDEEIVANWNSVVGIDDEVYHLGDFAVCDVDRCERIASRLNGIIYLVRGNHDQTAIAIRDRFEWVKDYHEMHYADPDSLVPEQMIVLMHYPLRDWNAFHKGAWQLHGHSHGTLPNDPALLSMDVGVDCHNLTPISFKQIRTLMQQKTFYQEFCLRRER